MKERIVSSLAKQGWHKDRIVDVFSKSYKTYFGPRPASIWLSFEPQYNRHWLHQGNFTSAGDNVLASNCAMLPAGMDQGEVDQAIQPLVEGMDRAISRAYSMHLLEVLG